MQRFYFVKYTQNPQPVEREREHQMIEKGRIVSSLIRNAIALKKPTRIIFSMVEKNKIPNWSQIRLGMHYSFYIVAHNGQLVCGWLVLRKSDHFSLVFHIFHVIYAWLIVDLTEISQITWLRLRGTKRRWSKRWPNVCVSVCGVHVNVFHKRVNILLSIIYIFLFLLRFLL